MGPLLIKPVGMMLFYAGADTYSTTAQVAAPYKLAAILLTGFAGAAATLQSIFALQPVFTMESECRMTCKLLHANEVGDARAVFCA